MNYYKLLNIFLLYNYAYVVTLMRSCRHVLAEDPSECAECRKTKRHAIQRNVDLLRVRVKSRNIHNLIKHHETKTF